jgi:hypothetical protein
MDIKFGARMNVNSMACYNNPATGKQDKLSEKMAYAVIPYFNDELTRFVLDHTRDEVVVTPERVQYQSRSGKGIVEGFNLKIQLKGIPEYSDSMGMTYGFNPFAEVGKKNRMQGALQAKVRVLNEIISRDKFAEQWLKNLERRKPTAEAPPVS